MKFETSVPYSIGMELEFQLLDKHTLNLVDGIVPLLDFYSNNPYVTPEFIQNTVEVASRVCYSIRELEIHFYDVVTELNDHCHSLGMCLSAAGTHPFSKSMAHVTPKPRYLAMEANEAYRSHTQITFATHVHIGMRSAEESIKVMNKLRPYLPLLMGLSANSPFWRGNNTGYASYRHRILAATRSYGMPPAFANWKSFVDFYTLAEQAEVYHSINDLHWDMRPRPHLGTLEIRIMDAQSSIHDAILRAAFLQALVHYLREQVDSRNAEPIYEYDYWLQKDNLYQASHLGLKAKHIQHHSKKIISLHHLFDDTFDKMVAFYQQEKNNELNVDLKYLYTLRDQIKQPYGYLSQIKNYQETSSLKSVTQRLVDELEDDIGKQNSI